MKVLIVIMTSLLLSHGSFAVESPNNVANETLLQSYQKEMAFLKSYRVQIEKKLTNLEKQTTKETQSGQEVLTKKETQWLSLQSKIESLSTKIDQLERENEVQLDTKKNLENIIEQAQYNDTALTFEKGETLTDQLQASFSSGLSDLKKSQSVTEVKGSFFNSKGERVDGTVLHYGSISQFGLSDKESGLLYPIGSGNFRIWEQQTPEEVKAIASGTAATTPLFLYESAQTGFSLPDQKTLLDTIQAGGVIAWILVAMGLLAAALSAMRFWLLRTSGQVQGEDLEGLYDMISSHQLDQALSLAQSKSSSTFRVLTETIKSLKKSSMEAIEEVIAENILRESLLIDRFGTVLTIIASVATLLGLLGTVTGMINTFEMITEYGNTNPKLLSGGISEALITTKFGLVVAIPTILVSQLLSSWNESIKTKMEEAALAICNRFQNGEM